MVTGRYAGRSTFHPHDTKMARVRSYVMARDTDPVTRLVMCGICGHGGGVDGVDHIVPASECESRGISLWNTNNLRAAHSKVACPTCSLAAKRQIFCNSLRGALSTPAARLKISKLTSLRIVDVDASKHGGKLARPAEEPDRWLAKCAMYQVIPVAEHANLDVQVAEICADWNSSVGQAVSDRVREVEARAKALAPVSAKGSKYAPPGYLRSRVISVRTHSPDGSILGRVGVPKGAGGNRYPLMFVSNAKGFTVNRGHGSLREAHNLFLSRALDEVL